MKIHKLIVVSCALALLGSPALFAAEGDAAPAKKTASPTARIDKLATDLGLDAAAKTKVAGILKERSDALRKAGKDAEAKKKAVDDANAKINALLTPEQQAKFAKSPYSKVPGKKPQKTDKKEKKKPAAE